MATMYMHKIPIHRLKTARRYRSKFALLLRDHTSKNLATYSATYLTEIRNSRMLIIYHNLKYILMFKLFGFIPFQ